MAKRCVLLTAVLAVCAASSIREKRQTHYINCGQNNGPVTDPEDCSFYYDCYNGYGTRKACIKGLEFNPSNLQCDYPQNIQNVQCQRPIGPGPDPSGACQGLPANSQTAHPEYCNAFMYCQSGYLLDGCAFCGGGQYFDDVSKRCVATYNINIYIVCNGRIMVEPSKQPLKRLEPSCHPSNPNVFLSLIKKIKNICGWLCKKLENEHSD